MLPGFLCFVGVLTGLSAVPPPEGVIIDTDDPASVRAQWPAGDGINAELILNLRDGEPLIHLLRLVGQDGDSRIVSSQVSPVFLVTVGHRDREKAKKAYQGMVFFENPYRGDHRTFPLTFNRRAASVRSEGSRTTLVIDGCVAGPFHGDLRLTLYRNSPLIRVEAVLTTSEPMCAMVYDAGLSSLQPAWNSTVWLDPNGKPRRQLLKEIDSGASVGVKYRAIAAEGHEGSVVVFPPPHQYFYPLDFADNFRFAWHGREYRNMVAGTGLGIRQPLEGDKRWVPWFDAPAGKEHHLAMFLLLSPGDGEEALHEAARFTHGDRFKPLPGYRTFTSHYHLGHTVDFLNRQKEQATDGVPKGLETPGFVSKFKDSGVEIVHLAEFHFGWTPNQKTGERLRMLKAMHDECARLSDDDFLLLPGEEPNVHLGGHWFTPPQSVTADALRSTQIKNPARSPLPTNQRSPILSSQSPTRSLPPVPLTTTPHHHSVERFSSPMAAPQWLPNCQTAWRGRHSVQRMVRRFGYDHSDDEDTAKQELWRRR